MKQDTWDNINTLQSRFLTSWKWPLEVEATPPFDRVAAQGLLLLQAASGTNSVWMEESRTVLNFALYLCHNVYHWIQSFHFVALIQAALNTIYQCKWNYFRSRESKAKFTSRCGPGGCPKNMSLNIKFCKAMKSSPDWEILPCTCNKRSGDQSLSDHGSLRVFYRVLVCR